jgi:hypothetical protein
VRYAQPLEPLWSSPSTHKLTSIVLLHTANLSLHGTPAIDSVPVLAQMPDDLDQQPRPSAPATEPGADRWAQSDTTPPAVLTGIGTSS